MAQVLWEPTSTEVATSQMTAFISYVNSNFSMKISDYHQLYEWSISNPTDFWLAIWKFCEIKASQPAKTIFKQGEQFQTSRWFEDAKLNFAENLFKNQSDHLALISINENGNPMQLSYQQLYQQVSSLAKYFRQLGIQPGDRIGAVLTNRMETIIAMLATASIGAIWSSCSPDFGLRGLLDRFEQINPKILLVIDQHTYQGKKFFHHDTIRSLQKALPSLLKTIIISDDEKNKKIPNSILFTDCLIESEPLNFTQLPFNHPLYILYSSGTTGKPKCMVHGAGGTLIQHLKELKLHTNLNSQDRLFFYTTCGWMMWNWMVSGLALGSTLILYDGSPFYTPNTFFDLIDQLGITILGTGAKYFESLEKKNISPKDTHSLKTLKTILTTGSPLLPDNFDYIYQHIKTDVRVSSISGGSDIISCFALGNPNLPVYRGELQCIGLGMDVKIFNPQGDAIIEEKGELVCTHPFPSMPIYFWNDPSGEKYQHAYFDKFPQTWAHGDYALLTHRNTLIIYGRADATLNPGGIRIGTAEIYQQLEKFPQIEDSIAVGHQSQEGEKIILFVVLKNQQKLTPELITEIKTTIRTNTSPHHVPQQIIQAPDLPKTINDKPAELAVKNTINKEAVTNLDALKNPQSLTFFEELDLEKN